MKKLWTWLQHPWVATALNFTLAMAAYLGNQLHQVFCQPVTWAAIVLFLAFIPVVFWPLLKDRWQLLHPILHFVRGIAFCICLYCMLFMEGWNFVLPLFIPLGFGIAGLVPHFFAGQMIYAFFKRSQDWMLRGTFLVGISCALITAAYFVWDFRAAIPIAKQLVAAPEPYDGPHAHAVEWIIGMHFKYHTREEVVYDGWRPPLHDPAGVIGFWSIGRVDPIPMGLERRVDLYEIVFPHLDPQAHCACAMDGSSYLGPNWLK
jgi:hypothetical protein